MNFITLTPNRRLSAALLKTHAAACVAAGKTSWESVRILPISTWLDTLWKDYTLENFPDDKLHPYILDSHQEQFIWENILTSSDENNYLLQISNTAELAKSAFSVLKQWQVNIAELEENENSGIFKKWASEFLGVCSKRNFLDKTSLVEILIDKINLREIILPKQITLYGFAEISPLYKNLLAACEKMGTEIITHKPDNINQKINRLKVLDEDAEIYSMARWARARHQEHPEHMIGCVVHNLERLRDKVVRIFSEVFCEENTFTLNHIELPFNISAGQPLSQFPIVFAALQFLQLCKSNIAFSQWSFVLRSPFLQGAEQELFARAKLEDYLRRKNLLTLSLSTLLSFNIEDNCPILAKHLTDFAIILPTIDEKKIASEWVTTFVTLLNALGWPGNRSLTSPEYQVTQEWLRILSEFAGLDHSLGKLSFASALDYFTRFLTARIFQVESPERNIQILGMLEAADLPFDYLWSMGLDDSVWPPSPKPNPFIPYALQRTLQMPHATAERELLYCQELMDQLCRSAGDVIFSYASKKEDAELRPSPLISVFDEIDISELSLSPLKEKTLQLFASKQCEDLEDNKAPDLLPDEMIRGGMSIFKLQAACAFHAFAEIRLHARSPDELTVGLTSAKRGEIMHKALEIVWSELQDQQTLLAASEQALQNIISDSVKKTLAVVVRVNTKRKRYLSLEAQRLEKLILEWLKLEKDRAPFKVHALEAEKTLTFHNIPIKLRIDRVDEIAHQKYMIIDYKTSKKVSDKAWLGERPDEPQLPLYCVIDPTNVAGIAFGQVNASEIALKEMSQTTTDWHAQIQEWNVNLEKLANDFKQGISHVDPKHSEETCRYCKLHGLCRVYQT